jgi:hypothetical protein
MLEVVGALDGIHPQGARVFPAGSENTYFSPALLPLVKPEISLSFIYLRQDLSLGYFARPMSSDVTLNIYRARKLNSDGTTSRLLFRPLPTEKLRNPRGSRDPDQLTTFLKIGAVIPLLPKKLVLGIYALLPSGFLSKQDTFFVDEREQYFSNSLRFELLEDRLLGSTLSVGLGGRPCPWLSAGMGMTLVNVAEVQTFVYVPEASDQETVDTASRIDLQSRWVPHFNLVIQPIVGLTLSASLHLSLKTTTQGSGDIQFWDYDYPDDQQSLVQNFNFIQGFSPLRIGMGVHWAPPNQVRPWGIGISILWAEWSSYRDRNQMAPLDAWSDNWSLVLGVEWQSWGYSWAVDLFHVTSPVPTQSGRTNYVDNQRSGFSLGWLIPFDLWKTSFSLSLQVQLQHLWYRKAIKDSQAQNPVFDEFPDSIDIQTGEFIFDSAGFQTNNPGWPGFSSDGWIIGGGISFKAYL